MKLSEFTGDMEVIQKLATFPNADDGLTAEQLKAKFDQAPSALKEYINKTLVPAVRNLQSKGGSLVVTVADGVADKSLAEVLAAAEEQRHVVLLFGEMRLGLIHADESGAIFTAVADGQMTAKVVMDADGMLSEQTFQLASKKDANAAIEATKAYYINIVEDEDENLVADKLFDEIRTHYHSGASLFANYNGIILPLSFDSSSVDRSFVFEGTVENEHYRFTVYGDQSVDGARTVLATTQDLDGKVDVMWGSGNKGKFLVIGSDGKVSAEEKAMGGGGLSANAKSLLMAVLRSAVYTSDQVSNLSALEVALAESGGGSGGGVTTCIITHELTNVTLSSEMGTIVESGSEYIAELIPDTAHDITSVTVTMDGADITSAVYADGVVNIPIVSGNVVITAVAEIPASLLHYWDFTESMVDKVGGQEALIPNTSVVNTRQNKAYRDDGGVHLNTIQDYVYFVDIFDYNRTYEIDFGDFDAQFGVDAGKHAHLLCLNDDDNPNDGGKSVEGHGLLYRSYGGTIGWQTHVGPDVHKSATWDGQVISEDVNVFANKTLKVVISENGAIAYYIDNKLALAPTTVMPYTSLPLDMHIGDYTISPWICTIKGVRVYEGVR